ncbi:MAG: class I SAM-dependent methyltransferase [Thiohalobacteraceae bacterium]
MAKNKHPTAKPSKKSRKPTQAERADRHILYQKSVQDTGFEFEFVDATFKRLRGRRARRLREDFCGTAAMCCEWVRQRRDNHAVGVDLDPDVLDWGREHNLAGLKPSEQRRVSLVEGDVLSVALEPAELLLAMNFSYQCFKDRAMLRRYFESVHRGLTDDGVFIMDAFGGYDAFREMTERTDHKKFTYIWDQHRYDPITGDMLCYIHFAFPDGSKLKRAFAYEWRLWTLPELQEILREAGFQRVTVYWQGTEEGTNEGDGVFEPAEHGEADPAWICFVSAEK